MLNGFKDFIMRGNVIELAVAVVIGAAFNAIVTKVVESIFNPLISAIFKADALDSALIVELPGGAALQFGAVIGAVINFLLVAAVVYFVFVVPMNKMKERQAAKAAVEETEEPAPIEQQLLTEIRDLLAQKQH
ncbi:large conductance mechanosensitive channel protein MscL [Leucobacter sp. OH2974_COT-288]|uniref:Large-conductance mechanosensitive channel n=1 Tax=Canibacter oris TaxID=1365628 RepID=A0A840DJ00_9MICO|nr:large conductance mechanosensitive channel protein MscL [Canibacter oris]MBB4071735.1 large conductance mechanosensitive channel [Canibacter oris]RRD35151.1 large conductance mechanosensitive channel protein MscL [Leucobacter sp. OH2974_COT-288]